MIVGFVWIGSRYGLAGAAWGVLVATVVVTALMADLVRRVCHVQWRDVLQPQAAGVTAACGVLVSIWFAGRLLRAWYVLEAPPLLTLACESLACCLFGIVYFYTSPFTDARTLVVETLRARMPWSRQAAPLTKAT
jgi:hypothetical protein